MKHSQRVKIIAVVAVVVVVIVSSVTFIALNQSGSMAGIPTTVPATSSDAATQTPDNVAVLPTAPATVVVTDTPDDTATTLPTLISESTLTPTLPSVVSPTNTAVPPSPTNTALPSPELTPTPTVRPFPAEELQATLNQAGGTFGVVVYDVTLNETMYTQNEDLIFSAASLIKIPIALTAYHLADMNQLDLNEQLTLNASDIVGGTGSLQYAQVGSTYTLRDLVARMLYDSDNTAANMILQRVGGIDQVNTFLADLGMQETQAQRFLMDFAALQAGRDNLTSPNDMAVMLQILARNEVTGSQELLDAMARNLDQQKIPALLPEGVAVANKTGVLPAPGGVEHDAALITLPDGHQYILVVLSKDLPNNQAAITAIAQASRLIYAYEQQLDL
jgi:beta-lactamase class A